MFGPKRLGSLFSRCQGNILAPTLNGYSLAMLFAAGLTVTMIALASAGGIKVCCYYRPALRHCYLDMNVVSTQACPWPPTCHQHSDDDATQHRHTIIAMRSVASQAPAGWPGCRATVKRTNCKRCTEMT